ncbi:signal peptide peptidase SppA [Parabacteroides sp. An277]|uniref:signal peptide peptidase SppA n=1 Tax=Parabacteroides sp. An277 TaxID=1965619 RepID=UPI000B3A4628|nr:signal peptide peptidase SppA [Parabacteroides sp. An277]OUO53515.1 signal peptide peptidase SppA [Parabacteroides sp. An277]
MKQFFKTMFASIFGVLIAMGVLLMGGIAFVAGIVASNSSSSTYKPAKNTVFKLSLKGTLTEHSSDNPFAGLWSSSDEQVVLPDLIRAIQKAKQNPDIQGIYLEGSELSGGFASFAALRRALEDFKSEGKFIVSYADAYSQGGYYLASVADSLFVNPQGMVGLVGLASQGIFFKNAMAKLGVEYYIFKVGTYKSAVEPYMNEKFSEANREQTASFLNSIWKNMTDAICTSRSIDAAEMERFLNTGVALGAPEELLTYKLVDKLAYRPEAEACVKRMAGQKVADKMVSADYSQLLSIPETKREAADKIAILYAEGTIVPEDDSPMSTGTALITEETARELYKLAQDEAVKAVVFRVNSGGGSAYISEQIWKAVMEVKAQKPVVVSMGDYAASGGYYIACAANKIVAEPTTLTGSIGVFGIVRNFAGTAKLLDITTDIVKTNTYADLGDISRPMRADEQALIQQSVERTYDLFLTRCADGRGMAKDSIDHIGQGRVWTGEQALERGLVDRLGGLEVAIAEAASLAGITDYTTYKANEDKDFFTKYMEKAWGEAKISLLQSLLGKDEFALYATWQEMKQTTGIQARMPYTVQGL